MTTPTVTIRPPVVAGWANHADSAGADLRAVPDLLSAAVTSLEESGGAALSGTWALAAVLAAATAATADVRDRMTSTSSRLRRTATTYTATDATLASEINTTTTGHGPSWL